MENKRARAPLGGPNSRGWDPNLHDSTLTESPSNRDMETSFTLPTEPTESLDKNQEYPPIVTVDGKVDTDIDHLMVDQEDDFVDLPVQDIQSKFPKPRVVTVIEGSLDDDIDNLMNHDGTMTHTLVDAPKNFRPGDLKEINANKEAKKHRSYHKMDEDQSEEGFGVKNYEVVSAIEQNNSSEKYPEDEAINTEDDSDINIERRNIISTAETSKTIDSADLENGSILPFDDACQDKPVLAPHDLVDTSCEQSAITPGHEEYIIPPSEDFKPEETSEDYKPEETSILASSLAEREEITASVEETSVNDEHCELGEKDAQLVDNRVVTPEADKTEKEQNEEPDDIHIDVDLIENLTIMCTDAITKLALAEKSLGHKEQHQQLLAIANVLKHRIPAEKRNKRFSVQHNGCYCGNENEDTQAEADVISRRGSANLNTEANEVVQSLLKQVAMVESSAGLSSLPGMRASEEIKQDSQKVLDKKEEDAGEEQGEDKEKKYPSSRQTENVPPSRSQPLKMNSQASVQITESGSTQTSRVNLTENVNISAALKVAGDSMTAAAKMAEALSTLIKSTSLSESRMDQNSKVVKSKRVKEYIGRTHSRTTPSGDKHHLDMYQVYNVVEIPSTDADSVPAGRLVKEEDASSVEEMKSGTICHSEFKRRSAEFYQPAMFENMLLRNSWGKALNDEMGEEYLDGLKHREYKRRSRSCKDDGSRRGESQITWVNNSRHRRRSETRENEGQDISSKEESVRLPTNRGYSGVSHWGKKDNKKRGSAVDKYGTVDISKVSEEEFEEILLFNPEGSRESRRRRSRKMDKKADEEKPPIPIARPQHRESDGIYYASDKYTAIKPDGAKRTGHTNSPKVRDNENTSKHHRHKKVPPTDRKMTRSPVKHCKTHGKKERDLFHGDIQTISYLKVNKCKHIDEDITLDLDNTDRSSSIEGNTTKSLERRDRFLPLEGETVQTLHNRDEALLVEGDVVQSLENRNGSYIMEAKHIRCLENKDGIHPREEGVVQCMGNNGEAVLVVEAAGDETGNGIIVGESSLLDESWSLPTAGGSQCDSYFDRVISTLKTWAPPNNKVKSRAETDYIRTKLVGSMVDPDSRDSDFDSIEFNGNACVSLSRMMLWDCDDTWSQEEESEYDTSASGWKSHSSGWHYGY